jgi:hypothetical protein
MSKVEAGLKASYSHVRQLPWFNILTTAEDRQPSYVVHQEVLWAEVTTIILLLDRRT